MTSVTAGWSGRRVAVVGGAGFIGSAATIRLVALGADVTVVDGFVPHAGGHRANLLSVANHVRLIEANLAHAPVPAEVYRADVVLDLMGMTAHGRSVTDPAYDLENNLLSQLALFECLRRAGATPRVVLAGTRQVYGRCEHPPVAEDHPVAPPDPNAIHKLAAERYAVLYQHLHGIPTVRLRLTNVYGPRQANREPAFGVAGFLIGQLLRGETVKLYGGGRYRRDWLYVEDAVDALLAAAQAPGAAGQVYNIGHDEPASLRAFAVAVRAAVGGGEIVDVPFPPGQTAIDIGDYWSDARRAAADLGWRAKTSLDAGVRATVAFYRGESPEGVWPP